MKRKILWLDTETTGTDPKKHAVIQIAALFEIDGEIKDEFNGLMRPFEQDEIVDKALEVNNRTRDEIMSFENPQSVLSSFKSKLNEMVDKYNKQDKFILAGYNVGFDMDMMRSSFEKIGDSYFGSWFFWPVIDVRCSVAKEILKGFRAFNYKLETVCNHFKITLDAMSDIKATRDLYNILEVSS